MESKRKKKCLLVNKCPLRRPFEKALIDDSKV